MDFSDFIRITGGKNLKQNYICKRSVFPYLAEVLNRSKYDGVRLEYEARVTENAVEITFNRPITGNYFHGRIVEAYEVKETAEAFAKIRHKASRFTSDHTTDFTIE